MPPVEGTIPPPQGRLPASAVGELTVLRLTVGSLLAIGFLVWLIFAITGYGRRYAHANDGWAMGKSSSVELSLVREDRDNLACASDAVLDGLRCSHRANAREAQPKPSDDLLLRPYSTVDKVLLLGSGLWSSPGMAGPLPDKRFTVVCNFHVVGAIKSVSFRWTLTGEFSPAGHAIPTGLLSECVVPR